MILSKKLNCIINDVIFYKFARMKEYLNLTLSTNVHA